MSAQAPAVQLERSGTADGKAQTEGSGVGDGQGTAFGSGNFIANGDGSYTALRFRRHLVRNPFGGSAKGIRGQPVPLASNKVVRVRVKFLVGLDGQVETTEIITRNIPDLGFKEAAVEAERK